MIPAGFWRRYAAWSLDAAIVGMPIALFAWPYWRTGMQRIAATFDVVAARFAELMVEGLRSAEHPAVLAQAWLHDAALHDAITGVEAAMFDALKPGLVTFVGVAALYWITLESSRWQATLGKRALDLFVADVHGERLNLLRATARHVAGALSWLTLNLGHALAALPPQQRALHDYVAGTRVFQRSETSVPLWARAWLLLQILLLLAAMLWLMQSMQGALQSAIYA